MHRKRERNNYCQLRDFKRKRIVDMRVAGVLFRIACWYRQSLEGIYIRRHISEKLLLNRENDHFIRYSILHGKRTVTAGNVMISPALCSFDPKIRNFDSKRMNRILLLSCHV